MSYYDQLLERMLSYYKNQTKCTPDKASDVMIRMQVLAAQLDECCQRAEEASRQAFPGTATGEWLERHAAMRGLARKPGAKATGVVSFRRSTPAGYDIHIPAGTGVQSAGAEPLRFVTVRDCVLAGALTSVIATVEAAEPGSRYNLKTGSITVMVTPPPGVTQLTHVTACQGGTDPESDGELRSRLLDSCRAPAVGTSPGWYRALALAQSGVGKAKVLPALRGGGTVDLLVHGSAGPLGQSQLAALDQLFQGQRDLGVDLVVRQVQTTPVNLELALAAAEGWGFDTVAADCRAAVLAEVNGLDIGGPLLLARLDRAVMACPGVYNCHVSLPAGDTYPLEDRLLTAGAVTITEMEGRV